MQTLPILPSLNATPAPATPPRSSDGDGADQQFTQMLSRQISERDALTSATRQVEHSKPVAVKQDQPAQSNATQNSACKVSDAESPADQAKPTESANGTDAKTATVDKVSSKDKPITADQTVAGSSTDAALTASAAIMALVANAGPGAAKPSVATTDTAVVDPSRITAARPDGSDRLDFRTVPAVTSRENAAIEFASKTSAQFGAALQASAQGTPDGAITASKIPDALIASIPDGANVVPQLPPTALNIALPAGALPVNILAPRVGADGWNQMGCS